MPTKGTDEATVRQDRSASERLIELAVLAALAAGAAGEEVTAAFQHGGVSLDREDVQRLGERLAKQGLLQLADRDGADYALTPAGRRAMLALARECAAAAADFEARTAALSAEYQQIERLRTDLLSTVSHELRTPLTLIRTSIGLLLDSEPDEAMRLRLLRNIKQSSDRMSALVTDLLDLVRLRHDRTALQMRRIDVGILVTGVATLMRPLIDERKQTLEVPPLRPWPRLWGDPRRLERLVLNLVSNASKFAPPGARIRIAVEPTAEEVTITVADTGPGIPPEAMPHLFEQFYTSRSSSSSHNIGVGLGLPIAKSIAEAHDGRIEVESEVGVGSTFRVTLPRRRRRGGRTG
jgi:signal transduction histidine kinase